MSEDTPDSLFDSTSAFGLDEIRALLHLLGQTDVSEILIERNGNKVHIKRDLAASSFPAHGSPPTTMSHSMPYATSANQEHMVMPPSIPPYIPPPMGIDSSLSASYTLKAPLVGIFYASPSPGESPFIKEGDQILAGDTVCVIESMKVMNEIDTDVSGRVTRILVKDGQPVEYGQPLMVIEPV